MRKLLLIFACLFLAGCSVNTETEINSEKYKTSKEFNVDYFEGIELDVLTSTGDIIVENWDEDFVFIEANIVGMANNKEDAKLNAYNTEISIDKCDEKIKIRSEVPKNHNASNGATVGYTIRIPKDFGGTFKSSTGEVNIQSVNNDLYIETSTGDVNIQQAICNLEIKTSTGDVYLEKVEGSLKRKASTGNLTISYLEGTIDSKSSTGNFTGNLELTSSKNNRIQTSTGNVKVELVDPSLKLVATTSTGDMNISDLKLTSISVDNGSIKGVLSSGKGALEIITSTGNLKIGLY
ncbi:hypothetical protein PRVXT_002091 [Proteinivorax tanatarense]|uniref:Adhesin domain-containing protein n=1 Tax=Proteinivorax tanatarense TaxID=1260629 RepID=A0AAU7VJF5_9FIRM